MKKSTIVDKELFYTGAEFASNFIDMHPELKSRSMRLQLHQAAMDMALDLYDFEIIYEGMLRFLKWSKELPN